MKNEIQIREELRKLRNNYELAKSSRHTDGATKWLHVAIQQLEWVLNDK